MNENYIILIVFASVIVLIMFLYRKSTLDRLEALPGENKLFEEENIAVEQHGTPRIAYYGKCRIKITDKRIIIAQKILLSKRYMLRFVLTLGIESKAFDLKNTLKKGYYISTISKNKISFNPVKELTRVIIQISDKRTIQFSTRSGSDYMKIFEKL